MIPEDSILRRHYLTEFKNKQQSTFEDFILETRHKKPVLEETTVEPFILNPSILVTTVAFLFVFFYFLI